jgi:hypothetical protein
MKPGCVNSGANGAMLLKDPIVLVTDIVATHQNGVNRVSANAGGAPLWFESSDIDLRPAPEAFGSALLIPSLNNGSSLTIDNPVSGKWLSNIEQLLDFYHEWWGYRRLMPVTLGPAIAKTAKVKRAALFFSGGVDSFFSLLRYKQPLEFLVTVQGFDITLKDDTRMAALTSSLKIIAAETGLKPIIIRTNVREHPEFNKTSWESTHGGALAAIGHLLSDSVNRILISSTYPHVNEMPWGSHPKTDPLWSSDELEIIHFGAEFGRIQKLSSIAHEPLVRKHLRVCWENLSASGNCSRCEKCLRVRLVLAVSGELVNFPVFEGPEFLAQQFDELPRTRAFEPLYAQLLEQGCLDPKLHGAVSRLLKRSARTEGYPRRLAKRTLRKVLQLVSS